MTPGEQNSETGKADPPKSHGGKNLPAALVVGFSMFFLVVAGLIFWPFGVAILMAAFAPLGCFELYKAMATQGARAAIIPIMALAPFTVISGYLVAFDATLGYLPWVFIAVTVFVALLWRMPKGASGYVRDVTASAFIILYVTGLASFIGPVLAMTDGAAKLAVIFMCVVASDTGGYALGASIGKHKMAPAISPKKTWEGLIGSVLLACIVGGISFVFLLGQPWWVGVLLAILLTAFGTLGDLVESLIKRDIGIKDMSSILPGHGGIMDRLDSILVGIPAGWGFFMLFGL
ncbi:MAG: phosphatidate cytidylyltransferase [Propionibacteriaceae bacterium]|nr:phosphatidate cytidylyltransferase [Propionibacteriaceae bacterium]